MKAETFDKHHPPVKPQQNDAQEVPIDIKEAFEQKHRIYTELAAYRRKHGLGCFKEISNATDGKVAIGTIANMFTGTKVKFDTWMLVGEALKKLKQ